MNQLNLFVELTRLKKPIGYMLLFWPCSWGLTLGYDFSSSLNWHEMDAESHKGIFKTIQALNQLYKSEKALHANNYSGESFEWIELNDSENSIVSFIRKSDEEQLVIAINLTPQPKEAYQIGVNFSGEYQLMLNSD